MFLSGTSLASGNTDFIKRKVVRFIMSTLVHAAGGIRHAALATQLNRASSQMKIDSNLSAHHVTIVTDAGGFASIRPAEGSKIFRAN